MSVAYFHSEAQHVFWLFIIDYQFTTGNHFEIKQYINLKKPKREPANILNETFWRAEAEWSHILTTYVQGQEIFLVYEM